MISTALDRPPTMASRSSAPAGLIQGGILSAMLDDTMGPAVFVKTEGRLYGDNQHE
jgi:acyl-coenzyme A thioesterase PaaI-like protein